MEVRLGDLKPLALAEQMLAKISGGTMQQAGSKGISWFFRNTFETKLPQHVAEFLALADKIHDTGKAAKAAGTVTNVDTDAKLEVGDVGKPPANNKGKPKARLKASTADKCQYHVTFGENAYHCGTPDNCTMKDKIKPKNQLCHSKKE